MSTTITRTSRILIPETHNWLGSLGLDIYDEKIAEAEAEIVSLPWWRWRRRVAAIAQRDLYEGHYGRLARFYLHPHD